MEQDDRPRAPLLEEDLTRSVIGAFFAVYNELNYGYFESIYAESLARELTRRGHKVEREVAIVIYYKGDPVGLQKIDMIVDGRLLVEIKSTHDLSKASHRQVLSYLRGSVLQVGLLLHFGPRAEFYRVICTRPPQSPDSR